jgi:hypothetical protein
MNQRRELIEPVLDQRGQLLKAVPSPGCVRSSPQQRRSELGELGASFRRVPPSLSVEPRGKNGGLDGT